MSTEIIVASVRNPLHVLESALMGADIATIPFSVLAKVGGPPHDRQGAEGISGRLEKAKK